MMTEELEQELAEAVGEGTVEGPITKCEHGVYIAPGDYNARYCTGCNPGSAHLFTSGIHPLLDVMKPEPVVDAADYMNQPVWERLNDAERLESL
jgi:hypothetical protein